MDRFQNEYYYIHFPDQKEQTIQYTTCYGCKEVINVGEEILDVYGVCVHDTYDCLFKSIDAKRLIAGEE